MRRVQHRFPASVASWRSLPDPSRRCVQFAESLVVAAMEFTDQFLQVGLVLQDVFEHVFEIFGAVCLAHQVAKLVAGV